MFLMLFLWYSEYSTIERAKRALKTGPFGQQNIGLSMVKCEQYNDDRK